MKRPILISLVALLAVGNVAAGLLAYRWHRVSQKLDHRNVDLQTRLADTEQQLAQKRSALIPAPAPVTLAAVPTPAPDDVELEALALTLSKREAELKALRDQLNQSKADKEPEARKSFPERMRERMEKMQKENPEEYARMQERRKTMQAEMTDGIVERTDFFGTVDLEGLPAEYTENHQNLVAELGALQNLMNELAENPAAMYERREEMHQRYGAIRDMMKVEREVLMTDLASELKLDAEGAADFSEYIDYLYQMTTPPRPNWRGRGGGDRGGERR